MPRTKREGIFYGAVMAFTMSLFMNLFNTFLHAGVSMESLGRVLLLHPIIFAIDCHASWGIGGVKLGAQSYEAFRPGERQSESSRPGANGLRGDRYVAGDERDLADLGGHAAGWVTAALCLGMASEFLRGVLVANIGRWTNCAHVVKILQSYRKDSELIAEDL